MLDGRKGSQGSCGQRDLGVQKREVRSSREKACF